jgi:hypothetical protein
LIVSGHQCRRPRLTRKRNNRRISIVDCRQWWQRLAPNVLKGFCASWPLATTLVYRQILCGDFARSLRGHPEVEYLTDPERQLVVVLATKAWVRMRDDADMRVHTEELESIIRKLSGVDTRVRVEKS